MSPTLSAVVCTYSLGRWDDLIAAVDGLIAQPAVREVVVVVDHNDVLLDKAMSAFPDALVVASGGPPGLSGARNTGGSVASGDVVAFVDDDAVPLAGWAERLLAAYDDDRVAAVGGAVEPLWATRRPCHLPAELDWVVGCGYAGLPTAPAPIRNPIGANMSVRRRVLAAAGPFRDDLGRVGGNGGGCEETELCIRLTRALPGARVMFEPSARVAHRVPAERCTWRYLRARCLAEGRSKALVARLAGGRGLATERRYLRVVLPRALARELAAGLRGDVAGFERAVAIGAALACTAAAFVGESVRLRLRLRPTARPTSSLEAS